MNEDCGYLGILPAGGADGDGPPIIPEGGALGDGPPIPPPDPGIPGPFGPIVPIWPPGMTAGGPPMPAGGDGGSGDLPCGVVP